MRSIPIISIVGWHNVGKTTLIEKLVMFLREKGLRVAVIKHSRGDFTIDQPGTDTWRFVQAGGTAVVITGKGRLALLENRAEEFSLEEIIDRLPEQLDLVILEGFKELALPKIEVVRTGFRSHEGRISPDSELVALVGDENVCQEARPQSIACFHPDEICGIVSLLEALAIIPPVL